MFNFESSLTEHRYSNPGNLLMFNDADWSSDKVVEVPLERLFEYTEDRIKINVASRFVGR